MAFKNPTIYEKKLWNIIIVIDLYSKKFYILNIVPHIQQINKIIG